MTIQESLNRSVNLLGVSITSLTGFAFAPEVFAEKDVPDKLDDGLLFLLGLAAMWWYSRTNNRFARSVAPVVFVAIALVIKIMGIIIEHDDPDALGDDLGGLILLVIATGLMAYQYVKTGKMLGGAPQQ